jgi:PmbA protein
MDTIHLAEDILNKSMKRGCDRAEVYLKTGRGLSAEAQDRDIEALESSRDLGIALKVIRNRRLGFSFTTDLKGKDGLDHLLNEAVSGAEWTAEDEYVDVPEFSPASDVPVLDSDIPRITEQEVIEKALFLEKAAVEADRRVKKVRKAEVSLAVGNTVIVNSHGVRASYESGVMTAHVTALADDGQDSQMGWGFAISRQYSGLDFGSVSDEAAQRALELLGARRISTVKVPVILDPSVAVDFLGIFSASLSAEAVQKNRSFLSGKVNTKIVSPLLHMVDDGLMPWGIGSRPVDDEGVPTSRKVLVDSGVLTGYVHNTYTAKKQGVASTGNAVRPSFKNLPGVGVTNFYIEPIPLSPPLAKGGKGGLRGKNTTLITSLSKGILVREAMGVHTADPISGDFSVGISGLWIENGEIAYPVKEAVITGNILELFQRVEAVGDDLRFYGRKGSPSLLIGEMDISA